MTCNRWKRTGKCKNNKPNRKNNGDEDLNNNNFGIVGGIDAYVAQEESYSSFFDIEVLIHIHANPQILACHGECTHSISLLERMIKNLGFIHSIGMTYSRGSKGHRQQKWCFQTESLGWLVGRSQMLWPVGCSACCVQPLSSPKSLKSLQRRVCCSPSNCAIF